MTGPRCPVFHFRQLVTAVQGATVVSGQNVTSGGTVRRPLPPDPKQFSPMAF